MCGYPNTHTPKFETIKNIIDDNNIDLFGKEILLSKDGLYIKTSNKVIVITYLQFPSKKIISSSDAFNAYRDFFV